MSLVPLLQTARIRGDWRRRRRVEVLHETIHCFNQNATGLQQTAGNNLARWAREPTQQADIDCRVVVMQGDMLDAAGQLTRAYGTQFACLNMANATFPGGGYTTGCSAQEENMARRTQLHTVFDESQVVKRGREIVYNDEMHELVSGKSGRVYVSPTPLVCIRGREEYDDTTSLGYAFLPSDLIFPFLELRSAAVDRSRKRKASYARDLSEMEKRVEAQFATLISTGVRHVVLSAFGCGAFKNDPNDIARVYKEAVERHRASFVVIAFAIFYAGHGQDNYKIFKTHLAPED